MLVGARDEAPDGAPTEPDGAPTEPAEPRPVVPAEPSLSAPPAPAGPLREEPADPLPETAPPEDGPAPQRTEDPVPTDTSAPPSATDAADRGDDPTAPAADEAAAPAPAPVPARLDDACAAAVDLARGAALEVAGSTVGDHLGVEPEPAPYGYAVTHSFATTLPGYGGWRWAVTVARGEDGGAVTVDEVVLLPGSGALVAPPWVPWSDRVQPGDLSPGDLLPPRADDPRLVPAYEDVDTDELPFALHRELGLGRPRVLSLDGRAEAAERWYDGEPGPASPLAKAAPGRCGDCGFLAPLAGALGRVFGVCANAYAPDDAKVVALTHGCGAHSETVVDAPSSTYTGMAVEDDEFELTPVEGSDVDPDDPSSES